MYIVVTGAAGFVGANIVKGLNARGETDIIAVDDLEQADKFRNLVDCEIADYLDKEEFLARLSAGDFDDDVSAILHQGACSDTMETDGRYMPVAFCQSANTTFAVAPTSTTPTSPFSSRLRP